MSVQHHVLTYSSVGQPSVGHPAAGRGHETQAQAGAGTGTGAGAGSGGALTRAVERWRRALLHDHAPAASASPPSWPASPAPGPAAAPPPASPPGDAEGLAALVRRLDDSGCSYGRVSAARLDAVTRAYDRLETKMNAVLMAVTGTFLSTLAGLLLYYVRGGGQ